MVEFPGKLFDNYNYYYYEAVAPEEEDLFWKFRGRDFDF